jgi:hypothetical protein
MAHIRVHFSLGFSQEQDFMESIFGEQPNFTFADTFWSRIYRRAFFRGCFGASAVIRTMLEQPH